MQPGFEPFEDLEGNLRCGGKCNRTKPADHPLVKLLVWERDVPEGVARKKCFRYPLKGKDRCKRHAGAPIKHGLYSRYQGTLLERVEAAKKDPELLSIANRLAVLAAAMDGAVGALEEAGVCEQCGSVPATSLPAVDTLSKIVDRYASAVKKHKEVQDGIRIKVYTEAREQLVTRLAGWLQRHKGDEITDGLVRELAQEMQE